MRIPLKRYYGNNDLHFVTFSRHRRLPLLGSARARACFVRILDPLRRKKDFLLLGFVVMPEHVHLLISEPRREQPLERSAGSQTQVSRVLQKDLPLQELEKFAAQQQHFWQRRFYDFNGWSENKVREKFDYMHANPVKRSLVLHPKDGHEAVGPTTQRANQD